MLLESSAEEQGPTVSQGFKEFNLLSLRLGKDSAFLLGFDVADRITGFDSRRNDLQDFISRVKVKVILSSSNFRMFCPRGFLGLYLVTAGSKGSRAAGRKCQRLNRPKTIACYLPLYLLRTLENINSCFVIIQIMNNQFKRDTLRLQDQFGTA